MCQTWRLQVSQVCALPISSVFAYRKKFKVVIGSEVRAQAPYCGLLPPAYYIPVIIETEEHPRPENAADMDFDTAAAFEVHPGTSVGEQRHGKLR